MRPGRYIRCIIIFTWIPLLLSCNIRLTDSDRFPTAVRMHYVRPYLQEPEQCGPYALFSLLKYMGVEADIDHLVDRLYSPGARGTLTMDLYLEAERNGLDTRQLSGSADDLARELTEYNPVVVLFKYPGFKGSTGHFILVTGYSENPEGFFLLWGDGKLSWMKLDRFQDFWSGSGSWMLTVRQGGEK